ncbi:hypothetical protein LVQ77_00995 [Buttiauxella sp. S04-F03]|uniref:hypothetical protein n=1 Tax=Buttiauxella sp. W03-F01 TaxID=2904524 RepID=UPI001E4F716B|nr:hypothetical protein [Buttiauxella sp. W03-F01]MCE0798882.1 hypothetical protein [Buttiauxella sp. W03-F01]
MSWDIPALEKPQKTPTLKINKLFSVFFLCLLVVVLGCMIYYYSSHNTNAFLFLFTLSLTLSILFGIVAGWIILRTGMLMENNELIEVSNKKVENIYSKWASEFIPVIDCSSVFPDTIEIDKFSRGIEFNIIGDKSIKFSEGIDYTAVFQELLSSLRYKLLTLSQAEKIEIRLSGTETSYLSLWRSFSHAWITLGLPAEAVAVPVFLVKNFTNQINEWLEHPGDKYRLVVICNPLASDDAQHVTSDAACAWLLAPTGTAEQLPQKARLYRAMDTDSTELQSDLSNLLKYQDGTTGIEKLWFDKLTEKNIVNKVSQICNEALKSGEDSNLLSQHFTELILGRQGDDSIWITMALVLLHGKNNNASNLIVSQCGAKTLLVQMKNISLHEGAL